MTLYLVPSLKLKIYITGSLLFYSTFGTEKNYFQVCFKFCED
jgi:hypothetical protein